MPLSLLSNSQQGKVLRSQHSKKVHKQLFAKHVVGELRNQYKSELAHSDPEK